MPLPMQQVHASPPSARAADDKDTPCSVRTEVTRLQELSLKQTSRGSPKRRLRFALDDEYAYKHRLSTDGAAVAAEEENTELRATSATDGVPPPPGDRKRSNSRQLEESAGMLKRKTSELVKVEGVLTVAEERGDDSGAVTTHAVGLVECELALKSEGLVLQSAPGETKEIEVQVDRMELVYEPWRHELKFQLRRLPSSDTSPNTPRSFIFQAAAVGEYKKWVNGIRGYGLTRSTSVDSLTTPAAAPEVVPSPQPPAIAGDLAVPNDVLRSTVDSFVYSSPPRVKHFLLVRHGHYVNAHAPHVPDSEQVLSQIGRQQAALTGKYLELLYNRARSRDDMSIYHSDMKRAVETATIISGDLGCCSMRATPMLREGWPGQPYSTPYSVPPASSASSAAAAAATAAAASSSAAVHRQDVARMEKAFDLLIAPDAASMDASDDEQESYRVIVCHANLIRFFLCRALGVDPVGTWGHFEINHCSVTRIDVCENRPLKVVAVNETGHLPHSLLTSSEDHL